MIDEKNRVVIPEKITTAILQRIHNLLCHSSARSIYLTLKKYVYIPNLESRATTIEKLCTKCQEFKQGNKNYGMYHNILTPALPMTDISIDLYGPIKGNEFVSKADYQNTWLLTCIDNHSRWSEVFLLNNITSQVIIQKLKIWFRKHSTPASITTDNGKQFTSNEFTDFLRKEGINHKRTLNYNPEFNGLCERSHQVITRILNCSKGENLLGIISRINFVQQNTVNRNTGYSPYEIINRTSNMDPLNIPIEISNDEIQTRSDINKGKSVTNSNKNRKIHEFTLGQKVFRKFENRNKNSPHWIGPYYVKQVHDNGTITIENQKQKLKVNQRKIKP